MLLNMFLTLLAEKKGAGARLLSPVSYRSDLVYYSAADGVTVSLAG